MSSICTLLIREIDWLLELLSTDCEKIPRQITYDSLCGCVGALSEMFEHDLDVLAFIPARRLAKVLVSILQVATHGQPHPFSKVKHTLLTSPPDGVLQMKEEEAADTVAQAMAVIGDLASRVPTDLLYSDEAKHFILKFISDEIALRNWGMKHLLNNALWAAGTVPLHPRVPILGLAVNSQFRERLRSLSQENLPFALFGCSIRSGWPH